MFWTVLDRSCGRANASEAGNLGHAAGPMHVGRMQVKQATSATPPQAEVARSAKSAQSTSVDSPQNTVDRGCFSLEVETNLMQVSLNAGIPLA